MDAYLEEIETIIVAGTTEAGSGSSFPIFLSHLPDSTVASITDRLVAVLQSVGGADQGRTEVENPGLQILVRGARITEVSTGYEEAWGVAHAVKNALHGFTGATSSGGKHYVGIWNESGPFFIGHDDKMRPVFSNNLRVLRSRTT